MLTNNYKRLYTIVIVGC